MSSASSTMTLSLSRLKTQQTFWRTLERHSAVYSKTETSLQTTLGMAQKNIWSNYCLFKSFQAPCHYFSRQPSAAPCHAPRYPSRECQIERGGHPQSARLCLLLSPWCRNMSYRSVNGCFGQMIKHLCRASAKWSPETTGKMHSPAPPRFTMKYWNVSVVVGVILDQLP